MNQSHGGYNCTTHAQIIMACVHQCRLGTRMYSRMQAPSEHIISNDWSWWLYFSDRHRRKKMQAHSSQNIVTLFLEISLPLEVENNWSRYLLVHMWCIAHAGIL